MTDVVAMVGIVDVIDVIDVIDVVGIVDRSAVSGARSAPSDSALGGRSGTMGQIIAKIEVDVNIGNE